MPENAEIQDMPEIIEMIARLVGFDTTSRDSNLALIDYISDYLRGHGVAHHVLYSDDRRKANLYATIGPADRPGIVLSGHTDVVPVDGQDWSSDPFTLHRHDDKLFGRGTADMKSFIALCLVMVPELIAAPLAEPVHFAFSYDEEVGCLGIGGLIDHIRPIKPLPRAVIIGEPTDMMVINAHKGLMALRTTITGLEGHSSNPAAGANAIMAAAELIGYLGQIAADMEQAGDPGGRFNPPYTTVNVGRIEGGTAVNIIPRHCAFDWEYRVLPGQDEEEIHRRFEEFARTSVLPRLRASGGGDANIVTEKTGHVLPLIAQDNSDAETLVLALANRNQPVTVAYGTEAGFFQKLGIPAVVCGPGSIDQAHRPDEFISLVQLRACHGFLKNLVAAISD